ncbi:hypothetical protein ACS5PN_00575 [Roseateles sp. NT4]
MKAQTLAVVAVGAAVIGAALLVVAPLADANPRTPGALAAAVPHSH